MKTRKYKGGLFGRKKTRNETGTRGKKKQKTQERMKLRNRKEKLKEVLKKLKNEKKKLDDANVVFSTIDNDMKELIKDGDSLTTKKIKDIKKLKSQRIKITKMLNDYSEDIAFLIKEENLDSDDEDFPITETRNAIDRLSFKPEYRSDNFS